MGSIVKQKDLPGETLHQEMKIGGGDGDLVTLVGIGFSV